MAHTVLSAPLSQAALAQLDHLIAEIAETHDSQRELLLEHLKSARAYILGSMPEEYEFSLTAAKESAAKLVDVRLQRVAIREVVDLLDQMAAAEPPLQVSQHRPHDSKMFDEDAAKSELYRFFHGSATTLGVFYPTHYIFVLFPSVENAKNAAEALKAAGYRELVATSAAETFRFMNEIRADVRALGVLVASISHFFGVEEIFADMNLEKAEQGAGFLALYCQREDQAECIRDLVAPFEPSAMQLYLSSGIQSLSASKSPGPDCNHS